MDDHLKGVWDGCIAYIHAAEVILIPRRETPGDGERRVAVDEDQADFDNPAWNSGLNTSEEITDCLAVLVLDASSDARKCTLVEESPSTSFLMIAM